MFIIKTPCTVPAQNAGLEDMLDHGEFETLEQAIHAALRADLDLESNMIEAEGILGSVNDWIAVRIAGGDVWLG